MLSQQNIRNLQPGDSQKLPLYADISMSGLMLSNATFRGNSLRSFTKASQTRTHRSSLSNRRVKTNMSSFDGFSSNSAEEFSIAIMGDLHLPKSPAPITQFEDARKHLLDVLDSTSTPRVVQLGDLGSYEKGWPGSSACFERAKDFLDGFNAPVGMVLGNHDLEAWDEFDTDEENLAAWQKAFERQHYWSAELGPAILIGLSTTRFRSNNFSCHEVYINEEQRNFFKQKLEESAGRPVIVFTHAPPMGAGLKVMQAVHVKNRCAWLNHSENPKEFFELVGKYNNIKCWFSGHFHVSQSYPDSINIVGSTAFILTNVIGEDSSRNGDRQSRILRGNSEGFEVYTVDHECNGATRLDIRGKWAADAPIEYLVPEEELICDIEEGWLCSKIDCSVDWDSTAGADNDTSSLSALQKMRWLNAGTQTMLALMEGIVVEYDCKTMAPIGAVCLNVPDNADIRLMDANDDQVDGVNTDGSTAVAVELFDTISKDVLQRVERNDKGCFYQIFQNNKYRAWLEKQEAEKKANAERELQKTSA